MTAPEMSASEIQAEVTRLVQQIPELRENRETITMPLPAHLAGLDSAGCNWYMPYGGRVGVYGHAIRDAVQQVKAKWNLAR